MSFLSKNALIAVGVAGTLFVGYCIYFDNKRRSSPSYKKNLKEKRRQKKTTGGTGSSGLPDLKDHEAVQRFFLREVQIGEELLAQGDLENGVEHLSNAVAVCGQPQQLLAVLQQSLPEPVFRLLLERLPAAGQRLIASATQSGILEDDLE